MNFIEAVQALEDGRCEGILHTNWSQKIGEQVLIIQGNQFGWRSGEEYTGFCVSQLFDDDWQLVNTKPQMETVEVKRWAIVDTTNGALCQTGTKENMESACDPSPKNLLKVVELTGTYERVIKPKVKRRESLGKMNMDSNKSMGSRLLYWKDRPDSIANTSGELFYEWES